MATKTVEVTLRVEITVDEAKFDADFMEEFRQDFYPFHDLDDHIKHLAQLKARGVHDLWSFNPNEFVEGYGEIGAFGISTESKVVDMEILKDPTHDNA